MSYAVYGATISEQRDWKSTTEYRKIVLLLSMPLSVIYQSKNMCNIRAHIYSVCVYEGVTKNNLSVLLHHNSNQFKGNSFFPYGLSVRLYIFVSTSIICFLQTSYTLKSGMTRNSTHGVYPWSAVAAAAVSGVGWRANAAAAAAAAGYAARALPRWIATPRSAAAAGTHTNNTMHSTPTYHHIKLPGLHCVKEPARVAGIKSTVHRALCLNLGWCSVKMSCKLTEHCIIPPRLDKCPPIPHVFLILLHCYLHCFFKL
jgi:hypothetical protein